MKKFTHRLLPLALCFTLTLGVFAYRPSEAKAVVGVDDAVVIGALLSAFAGGCGLTFSNNGMTSGELAQSLTDKWNEFNEAAESGASSFAAWLGFEDTSALLGALSFSGSKLVIPRAVARKFSEFTTWLVDNLGISSANSSSPISVSSPYAPFLLYRATSSRLSVSLVGMSLTLSTTNKNLTNKSMVTIDTAYFNLPAGSYVLSVSDVFSVDSGVYPSSFGLCNGTAGTSVGSFASVGTNIKTSSFSLDETSQVFGRLSFYIEDMPSSALIDLAYVMAAVTISGISMSPIDVSAKNAGYALPNLDIAEGEEELPVGITGVGDGTATTIEGLLQQILAQLQANTLAPTLDVAGTETGGNTGADEDAKPYLPYIPQIFEKIKELPGTLANIWESIKGIPAAIAEKIGAFFTTLWGWLQNIIDAITALPAAIAEKIGALFKPDEALLTEITDAFKGKFGFFSTLKQFGNDLFGMTPETEPPVIWVHLENAESKFGYNYGDKQKIFDMTWYQKYKASVDGLLSGFLWLGYLWLLFKRAPAILNGMQMDEDLRPPLLVGDVSSAPRLGAGDPSIHYGEGFTFRSKGGKRK